VLVIVNQARVSAVAQGERSICEIVVETRRDIAEVAAHHLHELRRGRCSGSIQEDGAFGSKLVGILRSPGKIAAECERSGWRHDEDLRTVKPEGAGVNGDRSRTDLDGT